MKTRDMNELRQEKTYGYKAPEPKWDVEGHKEYNKEKLNSCLLYTSPSPRDEKVSRMPSSA